MTVQIPTVTNNVVEPNKILTVSLAPSPSYVVGSPSSATVTITSQVLPTLTLTSNTTTLAQGGAASFTISADQAPVKNISVNFSAQGTAEPGQNYVPLAGTAVLKAGQTSVTVVLQSIQSNITFEPTDMIVGNWPTHVGQVFVKAGASVAPGEAILSLTEPNLSVTLQATAAQRSELAVGQKCTIQISGENTSGTGVITELDTAPTTVTGSTGQSSQVYEGRIAVSDLTGADGSAVSITVVNQEVDNALTVPISAVKQNGSGANVVRVINLNQGGRVTEVTVTDRVDRGLLHSDQVGPAPQPARHRRREPVVVTAAGPETPPYGTPRVGASVGGRALGAAAGDAAPLLELESVSRVYGEEVEVYALRDVSLQILPGEFMSIVGPSGSGKSTMLGLLGVLDLPTAGTIRIAGQDVSLLDDPTRSKLRGDSIGFVFQQFHLIPHLTALGNVETALLYRDLRPKERRERASRRSTGSGWPPGSTTGPCRCPVASNSAWPSPGPSSPTR